MSIFAFYFASRLLGEMGWPRKLGRFKGEGYDTTIVDLAFVQMIDWGAALGAGHPRLALQMIAEMYRDRDWDSDEAPNLAPNLKMFCQEASETLWATTNSPREAVKPPEPLAHGGGALSVDQFKDPRLRPALELLLLNALLWGLSYPDRFEAWYESRLAENESMRPMMHAAGVQGDLPSLPGFFEDSAEIVAYYESDIGPLPPIPRRLLDDAAALGWRVSEPEPPPPDTWEQTIAESRPLTEAESTGPIFSFLKDGVPTLSVDPSQDPQPSADSQTSQDT